MLRTTYHDVIYVLGGSERATRAGQGRVATWEIYMEQTPSPSHTLRRQDTARRTCSRLRKIEDPRWSMRERAKEHVQSNMGPGVAGTYHVSVVELVQDRPKRGGGDPITLRILRTEYKKAGVSKKHGLNRMRRTEYTYCTSCLISVRRSIRTVDTPKYQGTKAARTTLAALVLSSRVVCKAPPRFPSCKTIAASGPL
jgi:hypothetical protein